MNTQELRHDITRGVVFTPRGDQLPIKQHNGWKFVNYAGHKIGISKIANVVDADNSDHDHVYKYIFEGGFKNYPCPAMQYWIMRYRMKMKITRLQFKQKYSHCFHFFKPKFS